MSSNKNKVLVIAHDAGAAEVIAAHVKKYSEQKDFQAFVAGPAVKVFRRMDIPTKRISLSEAGIARVVKQHADVRFVLLGTGWMTKVESRALFEAKKIGLKTVVYLESWVNYRERFGYPQKGWRENLPDEIWVGDKHALSLAQKYFPKTKMRLVANEYFADIVKRYKSFPRISKRTTVVFLSDAVPKMENVLEDLLRSLSQNKKGCDLRIRFHPADDRKRYDEIIKKYKNIITIKKSQEKDIVRDLYSARVVIGLETVAMVASVLVGVRTMSIVGSKRKSNLPFQEILRVRSAKVAAALI